MSSEPRRRPIPLSGVAEELGRSLGWLHRHIRELREKHGFPRPLQGIGLYDPLAIDAWIARQRAEAAPQSPAADGPAADDWGAILDRRAKQIGAKGVRI